jgi:hypothetical protein
VNLQSGPNGEVYAAWAIYDTFPADESAIGFARSTDGGGTFNLPTRAITNVRGIRLTGTAKNFRVNSFPAMAVDISGGPNNGSIYVVWANVGTPGVNTGTEINIYLIKSTNGGSTWSSPVRVNSRGPLANGHQAFFPWITCDPETGALSVVFYDDRNVGGAALETFAAVSFDGANTWQDFAISDVSFTPAPIPGLAGAYFGDYLGISSRGQKVYPVWTDNRSGRALAYVSPFTARPAALTLQNQAIGTVRTYEAQNSITAGPSYTVLSGGDISLRSGASITLMPGFTALSGSRFSAAIDASLVGCVGGC